MSTTLQYGTRITQAADPLQPLAIERLYTGVHSPKAAFRDQVEQLRAVRSLDEQQYRRLKTQLPYFVCGTFHPAVRRREHFAAIQHCLLDIDHLADAGLEPESLQARLQAEVPELLMCFASPSGDGLKLLFALDEPCRDAALYSAFYKIFARRFAERWGLAQALDLKTSDVTRACFMSYDPRAMYRPEAQRLSIADFVTDLDFSKAERDIRAAEKPLAAPGPKPPPPPGIDEAALLLIKQKLNPNFKVRPPKDHYVPEEIESAVSTLLERLESYALTLVETRPISYGRAMRVAAGGLWAEVNVFYGKRGFNVVKTTKTGSNAALADLAAQAIGEILTQPPPKD